MSDVPLVDWREETRRYDAPHDRLARMSRMLSALPQRRLLDVGCSTATLRTLLPGDFDYHGCDIADHAAAVLDEEHFRQIDFNQTCDLSCFAGGKIDVIHIGGVLEYLREPERLLAALRRLVAPGAGIVLSVINFQADKYADAAKHHPGWIYTPTLDQLRDALVRCDWEVRRQQPFVGKPGFRGWLRQRRANRLGVFHPWTRRHAHQFLLSGRAI